MNNSEHDPANPHSDNEDADRGIQGSSADGGGQDPAANRGSHDSAGDAGVQDSADGALNGGADASADNGAGDDSAASPSEDEVWRDLVARLESTESLPDDLEDTQPSRRTGESPRPGQSPPHGDPSRRDDSPPAQTFGTQAPGAESAGRAGPANQGPPVPHRYGQDHLGGPRDYTPEEEDDGFVPGDPPSLAGAEPLAVLAWVGAVGGPLALLLSAFFFRSIPMLAVVGIVAVFIASVVFLLMRLPSERGDDHDDGAIV
jgi:hypothetical protein